MNTEADINLIESYFQDVLSTEEKASIDQRRLQDEDFDRLFKEHTFLLEGAQGHEMLRIEEKLRKISDEPAQKKPVSIQRKLWVSVAVAASLLALVWIVFTNQNSADLSLIADAYYDTPVSQLTRSEIGGEEIKSWSEYYAEGDWNQAEASLVEIQQQQQLDDLSIYYLAHIKCNLNKWKEASILFQSLAGEGQFGEASEWNGVLCLMKTDKDRTIIFSALDRIIANGNHFFNSKAISLKNELKGN